jgi:hypothetical protein
MNPANYLTPQSPSLGATPQQLTNFLTGGGYSLTGGAWLGALNGGYFLEMDFRLAAVLLRLKLGEDGVMDIKASEIQD